MLLTCWSSKGGSGTTVVAAALAGLLAAHLGESLLVDLGGDLPAALGLPEPGAGLADWRTGPGEPAERWGREPARPTGARSPDGAWAPASRSAALVRLEVAAGGGVRLVPRGHGRLPAGLGPALAHAATGRRPVVVDAGVIGAGGDEDGPAPELAAVATGSLLVIRPCFLALRRAVVAPLRGSGVVVVDERHRSLGPSDIEAALGVPVVAVVPWDPSVARRVDAGLLGTALPSSLARALQSVVRAQAAAAPRLGTVAMRRLAPDQGRDTA